MLPLPDMGMVIFLKMVFGKVKIILYNFNFKVNTFILISPFPHY